MRNRGVRSSRGKKSRARSSRAMSSNVRKWVCGVAGEKNSRARCSKVRISRIISFKVGNRGMWSSRGKEQLDDEEQQGKE